MCNQFSTTYMVHTLPLGFFGKLMRITSAQHGMLKLLESTTSWHFVLFEDFLPLHHTCQWLHYQMMITLNLKLNWWAHNN